MQQSLNPWITRPAPADGADTAAPDAHVPPAAVISAPLRGMVEPDAADRLARRTVAGSAALWVTGAHGGSGESRIADLIDGARVTGHCWPVLQDGSKPRVLLVCRADMRGLTAARSALTQWASGAAPASLICSASPSWRTHRGRLPNPCGTSPPSSAGERPGSGPCPGSRPGGTGTPPPRRRPASTNASSLT